MVAELRTYGTADLPFLQLNDSELEYRHELSSSDPSQIAAACCGTGVFGIEQRQIGEQPSLRETVTNGNGFFIGSGGVGCILGVNAHENMAHL